MQQAEFERRREEFREQGIKQARKVAAILNGTDEETNKERERRRQEEEAKQREREERLAAAATFEKVINCKTEPCHPNPDANGNFCDGCPYYIANGKELENAFKTAIRVLRAEEEQ